MGQPPPFASANSEALLRLAQFALRLLASTHASSSVARKDLAALAAAIDSARMCFRSFGGFDSLHALQALEPRAASREPRQALTTLQHVSMLLYHPLELRYWLQARMPSCSPSLRSSQLISALWLFWIACGGALAYLDLAEARRRLEELRARRTREESEEWREARAAAAAACRRLAKLTLDAALALHWTVEHPTWRLSDLQLGLVGTASSLLAVHASWICHAKTYRLKQH
eukprot:CAMPEP_0184403888 /NCGR_PEP_ID=MMETSP0007-20130409/85652_1 /TAXON_ID=97485 /ORGANISM="Prymnesium parvum, Strain Texoma1" /LENGTH=229 /DNA_ID=CAMNT_0026760021 /DNA_START=18 /DNA_END=707 /DNA_ORIENTATION=+